MQTCRIAILGLGLIGSSLARALAQSRPDWHIAAFDQSKASLDYAMEKGFIHSVGITPAQAVDQAEIIVLATPPSAFAELARSINPALRRGAILTDTGSVKRRAIAAITPQVPENCSYVPAHPIAGSQQSGVQAGRADLFKGRHVMLTPDERSLRDPAIMAMKHFWEQTGANVEFMPPELHDHIYAYVSHLPQLLAFAARKPLQALSAGAKPIDLRMSRLMDSSPILWADICLNNADFIIESLKDYTAFASQMLDELSRPQGEEVKTGVVKAPLFAALVSTCLIATASQLQESLGIHPAHYAGAGFADMIASAGVEPEATLAAVSQHHAGLACAMQVFLANLKEIRTALEKCDSESILKAIQA